MKKVFAWILTLLMVMMLFTSCSDGGVAMNDASYNKSESGYTTSESTTTDDVAKDDNGLERKIIKTYRIRMETLEYDVAAALITSAAERFGGYVSEATQEGVSASASSYGTRSASFVIRIPAESADAYIEHISGDCNVLSSSLVTQDVTDSYYGYQARLDSLIVQEERLTAMLEKAQTLSEHVTLEDKLSDVRAEINGINSSLQLMDKSVTYSYVYVTLKEVNEYQEPEEESYFSRLGGSFVGAFESFVTVVGEIFIAFVWMLPYLLIAAVVLVIVIVCNKKRKDKKNKTDIEKKD